jgi:hypothetical protein
VRHRERGAYVVLVLQVEAHPAAVVAVERLEHDRVADTARRGDGSLLRADRLLLGHGEPGGAEQLGGEVLVGGDVDGDRRRLRRHRGADPLRVDALPELDEGVLVEPDPRDVARDRLVDDRLRRRPERRALGAADEVVALGLPVEVGVALDEVVDEPDGEATGGQADVLLDVAVDDVVATWLTLDLPGLAAADVVADELLQCERDVLGDVPQPGALVEALEEAAPTSARAGVLPQAGEHRDEVVGEAGDGVGGELLERAQVDHQVDRLVVGPDVGTAVDPRLDDLQVRGGPLTHARTRFAPCAHEAHVTLCRMMSSLRSLIHGLPGSGRGSGGPGRGAA